MVPMELQFIPDQTKDTLHTLMRELFQMLSTTEFNIEGNPIENLLRASL